jgi:predicted ArsR family transcriptional regulator
MPRREVSQGRNRAIGGLFGDARARLLRELCGHPQTAAELAGRVETSSNAVRVHLDGLRQAGLVDYKIERRGVGKPRHVYAITSAAENLLSIGYAQTLEALLGELRERLNGGFIPLLRNVGKHLGERQPASNQGGVRAAVAALESLGATVSVRGSTGGRKLSTSCCPLAAITRKTPEMCELVESLLASTSGLRVSEQCVRGEHPRCLFSIDSTPA